MSIKYCIKTNSCVVNDVVNQYFSAPELDAVLGQAERFHVTAITSKASGIGPSLLVAIDTSNDGVNWQTISTPIFLLPVNVGSNTYFAADEIGTSFVVGRFVRVWVGVSGTGSSAYVEVWVCGRSAA